MYQDYMQAFSDAMGDLIGSTIIDIEVSMGPAGEMRYPAYQSNLWYPKLQGHSPLYS